MVLIQSSKQGERSAIEWMCKAGVKNKWMKTMGLLALLDHRSSPTPRKRTREDFLHPCIRRRTCAQVFEERLPVKHDSSTLPLPSFDWSTIPDILLEMILNKLTRLHDRVQLGAVCKWWRYVFRHAHPTQALPRQLPMLMIPDHERRNRISFFSPFPLLGGRKRFYDFDMHIPTNSRCVGSTEGWLIYEERRDLSSLILLLNPFLSAHNQIQLPPHTDHIHKPKLTKLVLSPGASPSNYVAVAFFYGSNTLNFCRSGDQAWTILPTRRSQHDILYYKQQFYTVDQFAKVTVWDLSTPHPVGTLFAQGPAKFYDFNYWRRYIVEASGDLLLIYRRVEISHFSESPTVAFRIYKMDPLKRVWNKAKTLWGHTLFLGGISSMSVLASDFAGYCDSNCIYFGYDTSPELGWGSYFRSRQATSPFATSLDSAVFNLEDGSFQRLIPSARKHSPIWIEPKLQASS